MKKKALLALLLAIFLYTRLVGLNWGLPYPLHPDERNMADAVTRLTCPNIADPKTCLNPQFFAYGQVPLYLAYAGINLFHFIIGIGAPITYAEATLALRLISVIASLLTAYVLFRLTGLLTKRLKHPVLRHYGPWLSVLAYIFSPYSIQFSHFGTTESLLMLLYAAVVCLSLTLAAKPHGKKNGILLSLVLGLAIAVKVSSVIYLGIPALILAYQFFVHKHERFLVVRTGILVLGLTAVTAVVLSPQTVISWNEFMGSFTYESSVATGSYQAFYTRQFIGTVPVLFQLQRIFPFTMGLAAFAIALLGFFLLSWKDKNLNIMRFGILLYFLPTSFLFAKWARFMAPVFPLLTVFGVLFLLQLFDRLKKRMIRAAIVLFFVISLLPGIAYLSVYRNPDVRFTASRWIYSHIPSGSKILSETANVIDIPVPPPGYQETLPNYRYASFDFYHLDEDPNLQAQLQIYAKDADYIFVPTRRVFMDHPAAQFPQLKAYYDALFSGQLGYEKIREFDSYPRISLFNRTLVSFPDEQAEETWTVFDHPVVRIYKKGSNRTPQPDFSGYTHTTFTVEGKTYRLLVADNQQKWEQGLMWVRNREDANGYDGMIFLFPDRQIQSFWNKNTITDLDLYWIDGRKVVGTSALPSIEKSKVIVTVTSPKEADKVIELIK